MALNHEPIVKRCRALDINPAVLGYTNKKSSRNPGGARRKKLSEYGMQLREKQKIRFIYGILEKQLLNYYKIADRKEGMTGENLLSILETRFDNIVFRMNMAQTRREARQLVTHGHFLVNGKKANIPSMRLRVGDVITVKETSRKSPKIKELIDGLDTGIFPAWLDVDKQNATATVTALPKREDIDYLVEEHYIVEWYSKKV